MTDTPVTILLIEDSAEDAEIFRRIVTRLQRDDSRNTCELTRFGTLESGIDHYVGGAGAADIIFLDLNLPGSCGIETVRRIVRRITTVPIVVLTTAAGDDLGTEAIQLGAQDYLEKDGLTPAAVRKAIAYSIERFKLIEEKDRLIRQLIEARETITELREIIPICSYCKNIRNDSGYWEKLESYLHKHMDALLSHGICPECARKFGL